MRDRIGSMLGISQKAGAVRAGEFAVSEALKKGRADLVILADDASDNTKKRFRNMCSFRDVPLCCYGTKESLGGWIGCEQRSVVCITDPGLAGKLADMIAENMKKDL